MQITKDLDGNPIVPIPKCKNCGYDRGNHKAKTFNCPLNRSKFTDFRIDQVYEPKIKKEK